LLNKAIDKIKKINSLSCSKKYYHNKDKLVVGIQPIFTNNYDYYYKKLSDNIPNDDYDEKIEDFINL